MNGGPAAGATVAVVGGGIAGLAAALDLAEAGARVVVLEPSGLGGKLRTSTFAGRPVDEGPDAFLARLPWAVDLARAVGLGDRLVAPATGEARVLVGGRLLPLPAAHVMGVPVEPRSPDVAAVVGAEGVAALERDLAAPGPPPDDPDESIGSFVGRRLGVDVLERLVAPLVGGINGGDVDRLSLAAVVPQLDAAGRDPAEASLVAACRAQRERAMAAAPTGAPPAVFLAPTGGMATLVGAVVDRLVGLGVDIRTGVAVRSLERLPVGWLVVSDPMGGGVATDIADRAAPVEADAVVVAAPAPVAGALVADHAPVAGARLGAIRHSSVALVTLAVRPGDLPGPLNGSGILVPRTEGLLLTACSWASSKWPALAPEHGDGTLLLRASAGRDGDHRIAELDDDGLVDRLVDDLGAAMGLTGAPAGARVTRWPASFPQYDVGHLGRVDEIEADLATSAPTVAVAGCALRGVGIPASIRSGQVAAARVVAALGATRAAG